jgi:hypothetical protein
MKVHGGEELYDELITLVPLDGHELDEVMVLTQIQSLRGVEGTHRC